MRELCCFVLLVFVAVVALVALNFVRESSIRNEAAKSNCVLEYRTINFWFDDYIYKCDETK